MEPGKRLRTIRVTDGDPKKGFMRTGVVTGVTTMPSPTPKSYFPTLASLEGNEEIPPVPAPQKSTFKQRQAAESEFVYEGPITLAKIPEVLDSDSPFIEYSVGYNRLNAAYNGSGGFIPVKDRFGNLVFDRLTGKPKMRPLTKEIKLYDLVVVPHLFNKVGLGICQVEGLRYPLTIKTDPSTGFPQRLMLADIRQVFPKRGASPIQNVGLAFIKKLSGSLGLTQGHPDVEAALKIWNALEDHRPKRTFFSASDMPQIITESSVISREDLQQLIESIFFNLGDVI